MIIHYALFEIRNESVISAVYACALIRSDYVTPVSRSHVITCVYYDLDYVTPALRACTMIWIAIHDQIQVYVYVYVCMRYVYACVR